MPLLMPLAALAAPEAYVPAARLPPPLAPMAARIINICPRPPAAPDIVAPAPPALGRVSKTPLREAKPFTTPGRVSAIAANPLLTTVAAPRAP